MINNNLKDEKIIKTWEFSKLTDYQKDKIFYNFFESQHQIKKTKGKQEIIISPFNDFLRKEIFQIDTTGDFLFVKYINSKSSIMGFMIKN